MPEISGPKKISPELKEKIKTLLATTEKATVEAIKGLKELRDVLNDPKFRKGVEARVGLIASNEYEKFKKKAGVEKQGPAVEAKDVEPTTTPTLRKK
jgi:hypothetical protein